MSLRLAAGLGAGLPDRSRDEVGPGPGAVLPGGFVRAEAEALLAALDATLRVAPFRQ